MLVQQITGEGEQYEAPRKTKVKKPKQDMGVTVMPTDKVEKYAVKFKLLWKDIYQLHSEFNSLSMIEIQEIEREIQMK